MTRPSPALAALLLAAACSPAPVAGGGGNAAAPAPATPAASAPATLSDFPQRFRGRWGLGPEECDPANADVAKGLMTVEARRLVFWESRGVPSRIVADGPDVLRLRLDYSGEGQTWTHDATLTLSPDGRTLTRDEPKADTGVESYRRCPA